MSKPCQMAVSLHCCRKSANFEWLGEQVGPKSKEMRAENDQRNSTKLIGRESLGAIAQLRSQRLQHPTDSRPCSMRTPIHCQIPMSTHFSLFGLLGGHFWPRLGGCRLFFRGSESFLKPFVALALATARLDVKFMQNIFA